MQNLDIHGALISKIQVKIPNSGMQMVRWLFIALDNGLSLYSFRILIRIVLYKCIESAIHTCLKEGIQVRVWWVANWILWTVQPASTGKVKLKLFQKLLGMCACEIQFAPPPRLFWAKNGFGVMPPELNHAVLINDMIVKPMRHNYVAANIQKNVGKQRKSKYVISREDRTRMGDENSEDSRDKTNACNCCDRETQ